MQPWNAAWRERALPELAARDWDLIVVGGGITGAGILREAARRGWKCLLLEQRDFAWGTSSRSSKMVHGGLRYIAKGQFGLTRDSVRERQRLLAEAPGLVDPLSFVMPHRGGFPGPACSAACWRSTTPWPASATTSITRCSNCASSLPGWMRRSCRAARSSSTRSPTTRAW